MRFIILESGLNDLHSHAFIETLSWKKSCEKLNIDTLIFIHKEASSKIAKDTDGTPHFRYTPMQNIKQDPISDRLHGFVYFSEAFATDCKKLALELSSNDIVIIPHATAKEVYGISLWMRSIPSKNRPKVVFIFINPDFDWKINYEKNKVNGDFSQFRLGANQLSSLLPNGHVKYFANNPLLAQTMEYVLSQECAICPMTIDYFFPDELPNESDDIEWKSADIGILGEFRIEKGSSIIPQIITGFCKKRPDKNVFIQVRTDEQVKKLREYFPNIIRDRIQIYHGQLSQRDYLSRLQSVDLLLMPYLKQRYYLRTSGVFAEAAAYGIPVIVSEGTWMHRMLNNGFGSGVVFENLSPSCVTICPSCSTKPGVEWQNGAKSNPRRPLSKCLHQN